MIKIYTDGSTNPNPGPGGWGMVAIEEYADGGYKLLECKSVKEENTTNNRMEMEAILYAYLKYAEKIDDAWELVPVPIIYSDSSYAVNTFTQWMFYWERNNWLKANNKTPENLDIIQKYYKHNKKGYRVQLHLIRGHSGIEFNEIADQLAAGKITEEEVWKRYG